MQTEDQEGPPLDMGQAVQVERGEQALQIFV
jgi:hypothetical protein